MAQFTLPLALAPVYSPQNFSVAPCNAQAHLLVTQWPQWPAHALVLYGGKGTGKTHLGHIWAQASGAQRIEAKDILHYEPAGNLLIEDIEKLAVPEALFHAFNDTRERGLFLLMTSSRSPQQMEFSLPDLASRLRGAHSIALGEPDDVMLSAVLRKQFADRQLKVEDEVIAYLTTRMERSFSGITALASMLDTQAMAQKRGLTIPFVKRLLENAGISSLTAD